MHSEREQQRIDYLVMGRSRPSPARTRKLRKAVVVLADGIEDRVQLRERWSHKAEGTPETHEHADQAQRRPGSLARLYAAGRSMTTSWRRRTPSWNPIVPSPPASRFAPPT